MVWARNGASGALLTALLRSSPYWAMAKRAFFPSCSRDGNFPWRFQVGTWRARYGRLLAKPTFGSLSAANLVFGTAVFSGMWMCVLWSDRQWSFSRRGAGSVGLLRLEWRGICGACRFVPRSWSASVYSSKTYDYLGALWEILRVNVATLLVKEWMIILTVLHCKISSVMQLESPTPELHFC